MQLLLNQGEGGFPGSGGIDQFNPLGFALGEGSVSLGNFLVEAEVQILEPVFLSGRAGTAQGAASGLGRIKIQNQGEIGLAVGDGKVVDEFNILHRQTAGIALEHGGRVVKAVSNDPFPSGQGRMDELSDEFRPAGGKKKEFGLRRHRLSDGIVFEKVADHLTDWSAAWFPNLMNGEIG